ncbi:MAG: lipocalin-like domain-containing protein [Betaproteobacteria bacterium]
MAAGPESGLSPARPAAPAPQADPVRRGRTLVFPRDHGAHPGSQIEWWYVTGWLLEGGPARGADTPPTATPGPRALATADASTPGLTGFQITFFRSRTGLAEGLGGRFAPRQLLFAHAALTDPGAGTHQHDARLGRWSGLDDPEARVRAALHDADIAVHGWRLRRQEGPARWRADIATRSFTLRLDMARTQPLLLQGEAGFSRKGPEEAQASHYLSEPQLAVSGQLLRGGRTQPVVGRAWLDHEWSDELLHPQAVGWDWIGINLFDGGALTAFQLRRADGSTLWAGGSHRTAGAAARAFEPATVRFEAVRRWRSPATGVSWPVQWRVSTPAGRHEVRALADAQELDSRASTGALYWEGLSELVDEAGRRVGLGYLELTGYGGALRL